MAQPSGLRIHGARQNNLKNVSLEIPHDRLTVVTGVSGSGKSSLAFDTLFAEGQWRYIESLSTYAPRRAGIPVGSSPGAAAGRWAHSPRRCPERPGSRHRSSAGPRTPARAAGPGSPARAVA